MIAADKSGRGQNGCFHRIETTRTARERGPGEYRPDPDGSARARQRVGHSVRPRTPRTFRGGSVDRHPSNPVGSLHSERSRLTDPTRLPSRRKRAWSLRLAPADKLTSSKGGDGLLVSPHN